MAVIFSADDGAHGQELWISNGTADGTRLVKDLNPGAGAGVTSWSLDSIGDKFIFTGFDGTTAGIWSTDGTEAGTSQLATLDSTTSGWFFQSGDRLFGSIGGAYADELWITDGTPDGTKYLSASNFLFSSDEIVPIGDKWIFANSDKVHGRELWITDGTNAGTKLLKDIQPSIFDGTPLGSFPWQFSPLGNEVVFAARGYNDNYSVFVSDGTDAGTHEIIRSDYPWIAEQPMGFTQIGGRLVFTADGYAALDRQLWATDGTASGTLQLTTDTYYGGTSYTRLSFGYSAGAVIGDKLIFSGYESASPVQQDIGLGLWITDGTAAGSHHIKTLGTQSVSRPVDFAEIRDFTELNNKLIFTAYTAELGARLWVTDGTAEGTNVLSAVAPPQVPDIFSPGITMTGTFQFTRLGDNIVFRADDGANGAELWITDGTSAGTHLLKDINPTGSSTPENLALVGANIIFEANDGTGKHFWMSDGTSAGTRIANELDIAGSGAFFTYLNLAPTGVTLANASVMESAAGGTIVGALSTTDFDIGDTHTYQLLDDAGGRFKLDGDKIVVADGAPLDFETAQSHDITVRSTDQGGKFVDQVLTVAVTDVGGPTDFILRGGSGNDILEVPQYSQNVFVDGAAGTDTLIVHPYFWAAQITNIEILDVRAPGSRVTLTQAQFDGLTEITSTTNEQIQLGINNYTSVDFSAKVSVGHSVDARLVGEGAATGTDGNDSIWATGGSAALYGGAGNDTLVADRGATIVVSGGEGNDTIATGSNGLYQGVATVTLSGGVGDDNFTLRGGAHDQGTVDGGAGHDRVTGWLGDFTFVDVEEWHQAYTSPNCAETATVAQVASFSEVTSNGAGVNIVLHGAGGTLDLSASLAAGAYLVLSAADVTSGVEIHGGQGSCWIDGSGYSDKIFGSAAQDDLKGGAGDDTIYGGFSDDGLNGGAGADTLFGGAGNDRLDGGAGGDSMDGGAGADTYVVDDVSDKIHEGTDGGRDTVFASVNYTADANVELISLEGYAAINATGNNDDNTITGNVGSNIIIGGNGNDTLDGNGGFDELYGGDGNDTLQGYGALYGGSGDDVFLGAGFGVVDGGSGTDRLVFGCSADIYGSTITGIESFEFRDGFPDLTLSLDQLTAYASLIFPVESAHLTLRGAGGTIDLETELASGGRVDIDANTAESAIVGRLGAGNDNMYGSYYSDKIYGGGGNDRIQDFGGDDQLYGGAGDDTLLDSNGSNRLYGGDGDDRLSAYYGNTNFLYGGNGNDVLEGFSLAGALFGGAGDDKLYSIIGNDRLFGGDGNDRVHGGGGNDLMDGGAGADTLEGGGGDDTYYVDSVQDVVRETDANAKTGGIDRVIATASCTLAANVEVLRLEGHATISGTGNGLDNILNGATNTAANTLMGLGGNDFYILGAGDRIVETGGGGIDTAYSELASIDLSKGANVERGKLAGNVALDLTGNALDNDLRGNGARNAISGGDGTDRIDGGLGADRLTGGAGKDSFVFAHALGGGNIDTITDFKSGTDKIVLDHAIFTTLAKGALPFGTFLSTYEGSIWLDAHILYDIATGALSSDANGLAPGGIQQFAVIANKATLTAADFVVV